MLTADDSAAGFDEYFTSLTPLTYTRNPWFVEFWEKFFECKYVGDRSVKIRHARTCTGLRLIECVTTTTSERANLR